ncbi:hypothetical protein [Thermomonospora curvata]|uniref:hypothetical protein n=1 Tax=Thermomonospora curvata TaxID=2020 RepID=UPI00145CF376|nr:hypothetical protein [Thermomonospora curvata]
MKTPKGGHTEIIEIPTSRPNRKAGIMSRAMKAKRAQVVAFVPVEIRIRAGRPWPGSVTLPPEMTISWICCDETYRMGDPVCRLLLV